MQFTLKGLRNNKNETQEQTSKAIGVSIETWANYEKGITFPDVPTIKKIEGHFNISYDMIDFLCQNKTEKP